MAAFANGTVKFRVDLIKNFKILKENEEQPVPKENEPEQDPAIVETEPAENNEGNNNDSNSPGNNS